MGGPQRREELRVEGEGKGHGAAVARALRAAALL